MISAIVSRLIGLVVSAVVGLVVGIIAWAFIAYQLDFWYLNKVLGLPLGIILGGIAGYAMYTRGLRDVPLNSAGEMFFCGTPTGLEFEHGVHWIPPMCEIRIETDVSVALLNACAAIVPGDAVTRKWLF